MDEEHLQTLTWYLTEDAPDPRMTAYLRRKAKECLSAHLETCLQKDESSPE